MLCENVFFTAKSVCYILLYCCTLKCRHVYSTPDSSSNITQHNTSTQTKSCDLSGCNIVLYILHTTCIAMRDSRVSCWQENWKYNRLNITLFPLLQAANLVVTYLRIFNAIFTSTLSSNIPPSLTSDIWSSGGSNPDSYLSCTMHIVT